MTADAARVLYLRWLAKAHPADFARVKPTLERSRLGELGWIAALVNAVVQVGGAVLQKKQADKALSLQKKTIAAEDAAAKQDRDNAFKLALLDANTKRAQLGLPPVDAQGNSIPSASLPMPAALAPFANVGKSVSQWGPWGSVTPWILGGGVLFAAFLYIRR